MKICIFETDHFEGAYPVIKLFDNGKNKITIFCYEHTFRQFRFLFQNDADRYEWVIKNETESKYRFIYRIYAGVKKRQADILYLNTISNNFIFYAFMIHMLKRPRIIMTLHDINSYFKFHTPFTVRKWIRYIGKRMLIKRIQEFNVVAMNMVDYLKNKLQTEKVVHCVPGAVYEQQDSTYLTPSVKEIIKITIPGTIDGRRRNYESVFELLENCRLADIKVSVTLAGGVYGEYGRSIIQRSRDYSKSYDNLTYWDRYILDQPEFDIALNDCHFIFIPSVIHTIVSDDSPEIYGTSISSGNLFDIIKHAKPFIAPATLNVDPFLQDSGFRYQHVNDILPFLKHTQQHPDDYSKRLEKAKRASANYSISEVRQRNKNLFV